MLTSSRWFRAGWALASVALVVACGGSSSSDDSKSGAGTGGTSAGNGGTSGSSSGSGGKGGSSGSGGSGAVGTECSSFTACGGDVVGSWQLTSICNDTGLAGIPGADCATVEGNPTFNSQTAFVFDADGTYTAHGPIQFSVEESMDDACAMKTFMQSASATCDTLNAANAASAQTGFSFDCTASVGVCNCRISGTIAQDTTGTYAIDGNSITLTPSGSSGATTPLDGTSEFCVDGSTVTAKASDGTISTLTK